MGESCVGGLVGENSCGSIITSYATGDIASTNTSSYSYVGGLVGWNYSGEISSSYASGSVSGTGDDLSIGGLVGVNFSGSIISCYSTGDLTGSDFSNCFIGGLVGHFSSSTIISSYATSNFTASGDSGAMGGLVGENEDGIVTSCFWDIETSGINYSAGGRGLTTQQMRTMSIYQCANWANAATVWVKSSSEFDGIFLSPGRGPGNRLQFFDWLFPVTAANGLDW